MKKADMSASKLIPVILSGGSGTRLWPLSREHYPKQFLPLVSEHSLLQDTVLRLRGMTHVASPMVICNEAHRFLVAEQLRQIETPPSTIFLEPAGRSTAPAAAIAALEAAQSDPDAILLVLPADHVIDDVKAFQAAVKQAAQLAATGHLVTFGIVPHSPETGYGYIRAGAINGSARAVDAFVEKPNLDRAREYLASGEYLWNSGMFLFTAATYLQELERFAPEMLAATRQSLAEAARDMNFTRLSAKPFLACPSDSIDYAVMEKTRQAVVVPLQANWSDVGSWASLRESQPFSDGQGNVIRGDVLLEDVSDSYIHAESRLVAAIGVRDHIVVETADAVLVMPRDRAQDVKLIVEQLRALGREERVSHRRVYRPWGWYEGIVASDRFQVKLICVNAGASLSLQMHHHRAEHWVVVTGTARVTRGEDEFLLHEDESTYIPLGTTHRLENPGKIPLHLIEVQSGSYLGEDDIVRFEDKYGR